MNDAMRRRFPLRLALVAGAVLLVVLIAVGVVRAATAPKGLTTAQFETLVKSGSLAGVANTLTGGPAQPSVDPEQQAAAYQSVPTCTTYWQAAHDHLVSSATALPVNANESLVEGIDTELWDDTGSAASAVDLWSRCLQDFQEVSKSTSYPLKVVSQGTTGEVSWRYSESNDLSYPVRLLVLRDRNLIATFSLPDGPAADWRDQLIKRLAADVAKASKS